MVAHHPLKVKVEVRNLDPERLRIEWCMKRHLRYLKYVITHKYYVFLACWRNGLYWQGLTHDWHKFLPSEWFPYVERFGGGISAGRNTTGHYNPADFGARFELAWYYHQKRSRHHWQSWCSPQEDGTVKPMDMPLKYKLEMTCDWEGAGRAQGKPDIKAWWDMNNKKLILHPDTRAWFEHYFLTRIR